MCTCQADSRRFPSAVAQGYATTNVRPRTLEGYQDIVCGHLIPGLGNIPLYQLNGAHLQGYYAQALNCGRRDGKGSLSPRSVLHHHRVLREAVGQAVKWQLVQRNVADAIDPPRPEKAEMTALDNPGCCACWKPPKVRFTFRFSIL